MDLGIEGRRAIVCAASKGLGKACATALAREGVLVTINSRDDANLAAAAADILAATGRRVQVVAGDIALETTRSALLEACPLPDILVTNNGGPMPGRYQDFYREAWIAALDANLVARVDGHLHALARERGGAGLAESLAGGADDRATPFDSEIHWSSSVSARRPARVSLPEGPALARR